MAREIVEPTTTRVRDEEVEQEHPAWGMIGASRVSGSGAVLHDSDIRHQHYVTVKISTGSRTRHLLRDWLRPRKEIIEVALSEAQWASFVSSMNSGNGVPCTILFREGVGDVPGMPYAPRLQESMDEVRGAAERAAEQVRAAFAAYEEKKSAANLRTLKYAIANMPANITFAAASLNEHAEDVVTKARHDIEAVVVEKAKQLGLDAGDLGITTAQLTEGS